MPTTSELPEPSTVLPRSASTPTPPSVLIEQSLLPEDKFVLYAVLQDIANEIRRIDHEQKKHNQKRQHAH